MKEILSIVLIAQLILVSSPLRAKETEHRSRIGRLPCKRVVSNCTSIFGLESEGYLPKQTEGVSDVDYLENISFTFSKQQLQDTCKTCAVAQSKTSACISRVLKKCKLEFSATN